MMNLKAAFTAVLLITALASCARVKTVIFISDGDPVRLREPIKSAPVWVAGDGGVWVPGLIDIPAGWYCLPDPAEETPVEE